MAEFKTPRQEAGKSARLDYLDSLRGIAAILVVLHHFYQTSPFWPDLVRFSPFRLLLNGRSSVIFFFVLSGFVLAYGLWRGDQPTRFLNFVLRRLSRIYIPYLVAGVFAIVAMMVLHPAILPDTAITFNAMWPEPITWNTAFDHLGLLGSKEANSVNTPSWSLVYEIRISLLIPALCFLAKKFGNMFFAASLVAYIFIEFTMARLGLSLVPYDAEGVLDNVLVTIHFAACFIVGLLLAREAINNARWLYQMSSGRKMLLAIVAIPLLFIFRDDTGTIGSAIVIVLALNTDVFQAFLRKPALLFLGKISFSLYLTHTIVLQVIVRMLHSYVPLWLSLLTALVAVLPVAALFYQVVEKPALGLSKFIGRRNKQVMASVAG